MERESEKRTVSKETCLRRLSALKETSSDLIFFLDKEGRITEMVAGGRNSLLRTGEKEIEGRKLLEVLPGEIAEKILKADHSTREWSKVSSFRFRINGNEEERCYEVCIHAGGSDGEGPQVRSVSLRDVTDFKRAEDYLSLIKKIFEDATEAILILSSRRNHAQFNDAFCRMFGIECFEEPGNSLEDYAGFFDEEIFRNILAAVKRNGGYHGEVVVRRPDGSGISAWLSVDSVYDGEDEEVFQVVMLTDISELQESREMLRFTATHDALTGLPNRRMLLNHIEQAVQRSVRHHHSGAVFFIDLDNFKDINDSMGHIAGDAVLIECASRIQSVIRKTDIFGRLGGDEFLLITEEIKSPDSLMHVAQKIIAAINQPFYIGDLKHHIGASIGVAIFPHDSRNRDELLQFADMAMYRAKEKGKNRYQFYSSRLDDKVRRHFKIEKALRYALDNEGFYLVFQPQIDLSSEVVVGLEALLRIDEKIAGPLHPTEFIPVAEESDLILKIGRWVFSRCCQILYRWRGKYSIDNLQISINLSRRQLMDDSWVDFVRHHLERYHIDPRRIEFEITETAFMQSERTGYRNIRKLQDLGCKISIDDFGTGYSSLATLKEFTVDKLKIDKSFIDDIAQNTTDRTIVKASIAMAHAMGLTTIAEGIETDDQKRVVKLMGCKEMQGFLFSRPKRANEILQFLESLSKKSRKK